MSRELPIIFNTEMVKAILEGRKVCTRRPVKLPKHKIFKYKGVVTNSIINKNIGNCFFESMIDDDNLYLKPPYETGDMLYVRETWKRFKKAQDKGSSFHIAEFTAYRADEDNHNHKKSSEWYDGKWKPSIHMPKKYARLWLKVTGVRVERLQEITPDEAIKEGVFFAGTLYRGAKKKNGCRGGYSNPVNAFKSIWEPIYSNWDSNPWVWVIDFEAVEK